MPKASDTPSIQKIPRYKIHRILTNRSYLGEIRHKGNRFPGIHEPLVDRPTWDRVQKFLGQKIYRSHEMVYASELIECGHCGSPITGELKAKKTKNRDRQYIYYRCTKYHVANHPRTRLTEGEIDAQILSLFDSLRVGDDDYRQTFQEQLRQAKNWDQDHSIERAKKIEQKLDSLRDQQKRLLNLRMFEEIDAQTFASKNTELRDRTSLLQSELEACDKGRNEIIDTAIKPFELSQDLRTKWFAADHAAKRRILKSSV